MTDIEVIQAEEIPIEEAPVPEDDIQKPVLNKVQVSDVVKREKQKAYEKGRRDAMAELEQQQQPVQQAQQQPSSLGGMQQMSQADIERMIAEKMPQHFQSQLNEMKSQHMINTFVGKMQSAESKYPGLQDRLSDLDYSNMGPIVEMVNGMDNSADIMHELVENPEKLGNMITLVHTQPRLAQKKLMDLSNSIKVNEEAKTRDAQARDPLSSLKPSTQFGGDDGDMSIDDLRKMFSR